MDLDNLTLREGLTYETVTEKLKEANIHFHTMSFPTINIPYFRDSYIRVLPEQSQTVTEIFGKGRWGRFDGHFYYGKYELGQDFDRETITDKIKMEDGMLVERVGIQFWEFSKNPNVPL